MVHIDFSKAPAQKVVLFEKKKEVEASYQSQFLQNMNEKLKNSYLTKDPLKQSLKYSKHGSSTYRSDKEIEDEFEKLNKKKQGLMKQFPEAKTTKA